MSKKLSKEAYGGVEGSKYVPYIKDNTTLKALGWGTVIIGLLLAMLFAASNTYTGLLAGMTAAAGIPGAILGAGLLGISGKGNILKTNTTQVMASAGESIASGMIFVFPAVFILGATMTSFTPNPMQALLAGIVGLIFGVAFTTILKNYLIVEEHGKLLYPEGMAISETMVASDGKGFGLKVMSIGAALGAFLVAISYQLFYVFNNTISLSGENIKWKFEAEANPILIGIGYIVGLGVAIPMLSGAFLANFAITPLIAEFAQHADSSVVLWNNQEVALNEATASQIASAYTKYIGAGMMMVGGFIGVIRLIPVIVSSLKKTFSKNTSKNDVTKSESGNTNLLIIAGVIGMIGLAVVVSAAFAVPLAFMLAISVVAMMLTFLFVVVASRTAGEIGTSNLPVSGMTIASLLVITALFLVFGFTTEEANLAIIIIGTMIVTAIAISGGFAQSQKATFIIGGSEKVVRQMYLLAGIVGVITTTAVMLLLKDLIIAGDFAAPQANLMATLTQGILTGELPWALIFVGGSIAVVLYFLGLPIMTVAIGFYLPLATVMAIVIGALIKWAVERNEYKSKEEAIARSEKGVIFSSGLIAGGSIMGLIAIFATAVFGYPVPESARLMADMPNIAALGVFIALIGAMYLYIIKGKTSIDE